MPSKRGGGSLHTLQVLIGVLVVEVTPRHEYLLMLGIRGILYFGLENPGYIYASSRKACLGAKCPRL